MNIQKISNSELLRHYNNAVCDNHHNPCGEKYNKSGFTLHQLKEEIERRMDWAPMNLD